MTMRRYISVVRLAAALVVLAVMASAGGCYYLQAANGQWQVLRKREPIGDVIQDAATSAELAARLQLVQEARQFAIDELALPDNATYRSYADIEREFVVWNVFAAPEFSLQAKRWCFPVAGCVSYRGYFSEQAARRASARLANRGFDVSVGGVTAYSTLGHFNDPVLSSMMRWDDLRLVAVLFHELAHQVLYVKGDTRFNESFASAVEEFGMQRWLRSRGQRADVERYRARRDLRKDLMALVAGARVDLERHYAAAIDDVEKRALKRQRLQQLRAELDARLATAGLANSSWPGTDLNNARLASLALYEQALPAFRGLFQRCKEDFACFYARATEIAEQDNAARSRALDALAAGQL
jgi:predicted aminopeptidase